MINLLELYPKYFSYAYFSPNILFSLFLFYQQVTRTSSIRNAFNNHNQSLMENVRAQPPPLAVGCSELLSAVVDNIKNNTSHFFFYFVFKGHAYQVKHDLFFQQLLKSSLVQIAYLPVQSDSKIYYLHPKLIE